MEARAVKALLLTSLIAAMAFFPAASPASASDCPASITPVSGGYGNKDTSGLDDGTPGEQPLWSPGQIIVSLKRSATTAELRCVANELKADIIDGGSSRDGLAGLRNTMILQLRPGVSVAGTMLLLEQRRYENLIRYAAPNYEISYKASPIDEPLYPNQWALGNNKVIPKKSPSDERLAEMNDPSTPADRKASLEARYMNAVSFTDPLGAPDLLLNPESFARNKMPFSVQAARAWSKMPKDTWYSLSLGPSTANVAVIDSGMSQHYELNSAVDDQGRYFVLDDRNYRITIKPGAAGSYRLKGEKLGLGKFETCPIDAGATAAQVEGWLNRMPDLCGSPEIASVGLLIDADSGTFTIRTATGRIAQRIPYDVEPAKLEEYMRMQLGLGAQDIKVSSQGRKAGTLRNLSISFPRAVYDRDRFAFDDSQLKSGANPGSIRETVLDFNDFVVAARPANAPAGETWNYEVSARNGDDFKLKRDAAYSTILDIDQAGGVRRSKPLTKWIPDPVGHGTFIGGIIAANPTNRRGMAGVLNNNNVRMTPLTPTNGSATVAAAITHAADTLNADAVNISMNWGANRVFSNEPALPRPKKLADADPIAPDAGADAIRRVKNTGTLFVVAAGNESSNVFDDSPEAEKTLLINDELRRQGRLSEIKAPSFHPYPCRPRNGGRPSVLQMPDGTYDRGNILCVGAANWYGEPSDFTNWGVGVVDVLAPGENVMGTKNDGQSFKTGDGTSFAAPVVTGIAAMIKQKYPGINEASIVKCAILSSATTRPAVVSGLDFGTVWRDPFKSYADRNMLGDDPGRLPVSKKVFTVTGMVQADEALSAAGSLWSRYRKAIRKNTTKPRCVQQRSQGALWGKGKWVDAPLLGAGY